MVFNTILSTITNLGIFSVVIPFLLAFTLSYTIFEKIKIMDHRKNLITSLTIGLLTTSSMQISASINSFLEKVGLGLIVILGIMLILGIFGIKSTTKLSWIGALVFTVILYFQFKNEALTIFLQDLIINKYTLILLACLLTFWWITGFPSFSFTTPAAQPQSRMVTPASEATFTPHGRRVGEIPRSELGHNH